MAVFLQPQKISQMKRELRLFSSISAQLLCLHRVLAALQKNSRNSLV